MARTSFTAAAAAAANLAVIVAIFFLLLPGALTSDESQILIGDDEMQNDDLIVSKRDAECPPDDEDDCEYDIKTNNKDALIFPISASSTKKTRRPPTSTTPLPSKSQESVSRDTSLSFGDGKKGSSDNHVDDDEDTADESSGSSDVTIDGPETASVASTADNSDGIGQSSLPTPTSPQTIATPQYAGGGSKQSPDTRATEASGSEYDRRTQDTGSPIQSPVELETSATAGSSGHPAANKEQPPPHHQQHPPGEGSFWPTFPTTFNINIYLMIAIAAAFLVLIIILIIAVCKYTGNGSRHHHIHRQGVKSQTSCRTVNVGSGVISGGTSAMTSGPGNKSGYAYEACNTSPPQLPHHHVSNAAEAMPLVNTMTTNVHHPNYPSSSVTTPGHMMMTTPSPFPVGNHQHLPAVQTPMNDASKPIVKKDVKEWYV